mmetsp:Transcript_14331/g.51013  ORF Transcript_14331/g.51013 Transcript_14331/m.51013 type:complete len:383 (-) Transcript_14331:203-1351(-)
MPDEANTPVSSPNVVVCARGPRPAASTQCHATSISLRCCGSITRASDREMPQKAASNSVTADPAMRWTFGTNAASSSSVDGTPLARSSATLAEASESWPAARLRQNCATSDAPGSSAAIPVTASDSASGAPRITGGRTGAGRCLREARSRRWTRRAVIASTDGRSKRSTTASSTPSDELTAPTICAACSECPPRSKKFADRLTDPAGSRSAHSNAAEMARAATRTKSRCGAALARTAAESTAVASVEADATWSAPEAASPSPTRRPASTSTEAAASAEAVFECGRADAVRFASDGCGSFEKSSLPLPGRVGSPCSAMKCDGTAYSGSAAATKSRTRHVNSTAAPAARQTASSRATTYAARPSGCDVEASKIGRTTADATPGA